MTTTDKHKGCGYTLHIKNMVCDRCKAVVADTLRQLGHTPLSVELGLARIDVAPDEAQTKAIAEALEAHGFELLCDSRQQTADRIKALVIESVRQTSGKQNVNLSAFLADKMHSEYSALSKLFSAETGTTIEKYAIAQKTELVKELISYGELSLTEIAVRLGYSSTAYLSAQFKNVTGMTPSQYKAKGGGTRRALDKL